MRHKNQERLFRSWVDVWNDIMRIFDNARRYNSVDSLAYKEADRYVFLCFLHLSAGMASVL